MEIFAESDRETRSSMQSCIQSRGSALEIAILGDVRNPRGLPARPHPSGQATARRKGELLADGYKFCNLRVGLVPGQYEAQHIRLAVHAPQLANLPFHIRAQGLQDFRALHDGLQAPADGLDFGQFGHVGLVTLKSFTLTRWRAGSIAPALASL